MSSSPNLASFFRRLLAFMIDVVFLTLLLFLLFFIYFVAFREDTWKVYLLFTLLVYMYFVAGEQSSWKGSFGKCLLGVQVMHVSGRKLFLKESLIRTVAKLLIPVTCGLSLLPLFMTAKKQTLHDLMVSSCVIIKEPEQKNFKDIYVRCLKKMKERREKGVSYVIYRVKRNFTKMVVFAKHPF